MQYRAKVRKVSSSGVTVEVPDLCPGETFGPLERIGSAPSVGDWVLVADVGEDCSPDLIVVGKATTAADPAASVMVHDHSTSLLGGAIPQASVAGLVAAGTYTPYTPTWASTATQPVPGNATLYGGHADLGEVVTFYAGITFGSTTTFGTGVYTLSLPYAAASVPPEQVFSATFHDAGVKRYTGTAVVVVASSASVVYLYDSADNSVSPTVPFTMASGDGIHVSGTYRKA